MYTGIGRSHVKHRWHFPVSSKQEIQENCGIYKQTIQNTEKTFYTFYCPVMISWMGKKKKNPLWFAYHQYISHVCMCTTSIRCWDSCLYLYIPGGTTNRLMLWSTMIYPARIKKHTCNSFFALKYQLPSCCPLKKVKGKLYTLKIYFDDIDTTT